MKLYDLEFDDKRSWLKVTDFENAFDIYQDKNNQYFYNLNSTIYLNVDQNFLHTFICKSPMYWSTISYHIYDTTRLAWLLLKLNNIPAKDMFKKIEPGQEIKYIDIDNAQVLLEDINQRA